MEINYNYSIRKNGEKYYRIYFNLYGEVSRKLLYIVNEIKNKLNFNDYYYNKGTSIDYDIERHVVKDDLSFIIFYFISEEKFNKAKDLLSNIELEQTEQLSLF